MKISISRRIVILGAGVTAVAGWAVAAKAAPATFKVALTGAQQVPAGADARQRNRQPDLRPGDADADVERRPIAGCPDPPPWRISTVGGAGKNGPVAIWISKQGSPAASPIKGEATLTPEQAQQFTAGDWYVNVHTQAHPAGEIRGQVMPPKG